jgi:S-disulfanyl-L-cysteine oxidoreductase SoxD
MRMTTLLGSLAFLAACGGGSAESAPPATAGTSSTSAAGARTFADQAAAGGKLYGANCASCHGSGGEGAKAPRVVGLSEGALPLDPPPTAKYRKTQFKTAADVAGFVVKNMPPNGEKLKEEEYWAILAFDLHANGVDLPQPLDASNAGTVVLHK